MPVRWGGVARTGTLAFGLLILLYPTPAAAQSHPTPTPGASGTATVRPTVPTPAASPTGLGPFLPMPDPIHLPVLGFRADDEVCNSWVQVENIGGEPGKAALVTWDASTACAPRCAGPLAVSCSGLIAPGGTWRFAPDAERGAAKSGVVYSFSTRTLGQLGIGGAGDEDEIAADWMCVALFFGVTGDCDDYLRFKKAFESQGTFAGVPVARTYGPALAAEVLRLCQGDVEKVRQATSSYAGIAGRDFGGRDHVFDISAYHATLINHGRDGFDSVLYVQNGGLNCANVELWLQEQGQCRPSQLCKTFDLAQGTSLSVDLADCEVEGWEGSVVWLQSSEPLAVAVDVYGDDTLMTYTAAPSELRYTWEGPPEFTAGSVQAFGPLIYGRDRGWDTRLHVQNLSSVSAAHVRVTFFDPNGTPIETSDPVWVCPYGSRAFTVHATDYLPGPWVGSVRVESLPWPAPEPTPGPSTPAPAAPTPTPSRPNITAIAELIRRRAPREGDVRNGAIDAALAYNLLPAPPAPDRRGGIDLPRGTALIAVPSLVARADARGVSSRLAVANYIPDAGRTHVSVFFFDANGLVDLACLALGPQAVAYLDLGGWGYLSPSFRGSAVVSAVEWRHPVYDERQRAIDNRVGLAAVAVQEIGAALPGGADGDAFAATAGLPFKPEGPRYRLIPPGVAVPSCRPTAAPGGAVRGRAWLPWVGRQGSPRG